MSAPPAIPVTKRPWFIAVITAVLTTTTWHVPQAFAHGALHERITEVRTQLSTRPADPGLHLEFIDLCCRHGDWSDALARIDALEALAPSSPSIDFFRGQALLGVHRFGEAKAALDRFLGTQTAHSQALAIRARVHRALKATDASLADYRASLQATSTWDRDLVQEVADVLAATNHPEEALRVVTRALEKLGAYPSLLTRALELELRLGRFDAALARVDVLEKMSPRPEPWMAKRANVLATAGRSAEARNAWEALLTHLDALPNLDRGSPAIARIAEQARAALHSPSTSLPHPGPSSSALSSATSFSASPASHP
jgi:tetratricopeptide (TPR) repeat protein